MGRQGDVNSGLHAGGEVAEVVELRARGVSKARRFEISDGSVDIVRIYHRDGTWRMLDRVTSTQIGRIFARVTRAGEASRRPYGEIQRLRRKSTEPFQI